MDWDTWLAAAPAAFLFGLIVGYIIRGRYSLEKVAKRPTRPKNP